MSSDSCLVAKLSNFVELGPGECALLARLEKERRRLSAGDHVFRAGEGSRDLFIVERGWLFSSTMLEDGRRQVFRFHFPGDVVGLEQVPYARRLHDLEASTDAVICPLPKDALNELFVDSPRLTALVWTVAMVDQATFLDRVRVLGRMSAVERLAHLLLEFAARLSLTGAVDDQRAFDLPLTQEVLGDAIGLTNVYVSRTLGILEKLELIGRTRHRVRLLDPPKLMALAAFEDRYQELDLAWFPPSR